MASFSDLYLLNQFNETKEIDSETINRTKEMINRNRHYLSIIVTNRTQLVKQRKTENEIDRVLVQLNDLLPKLIQRNATLAVQDVGGYIDLETKLKNVVHRNLTYNAKEVEGVIASSKRAIETYSKLVKLN